MLNTIEQSIGRRFGKIVVLGPSEGKRDHAEGQCDCGTVKSFYIYHLLQGKTTSCGCNRRKTFIDSGKRFGFLTSIREVPAHRVSYECRCDCGNIVVVAASNLKSGKTISCGCQASRKTIGERTKTHGLRDTVEYAAWVGMKYRCNNPNNPDYASWGGRGITINPKWEESFEGFLEDVGPRPSKNHSLGRIDNSKGYYKENVRWETKKQQNSNKRNVIHYTFNGESHCLADWSPIVGISKQTLHDRVNNLGWPIEKALTQPLRKKKRNGGGR